MSYYDSIIFHPDSDSADYIPNLPLKYSYLNMYHMFYFNLELYSCKHGPLFCRPEQLSWLTTTDPANLRPCVISKCFV